MPLMAYLALDDPRALTRNDFIRLGLVTGASAGEASRRCRTPKQHLADFEQRYCYDRFWAECRRRAEHALPVQRPCAGRRGRCARRVLRLPRPRRAGAVPAPALPAVPDRALAEGGAADVLRPPGRGAEADSTSATPASVRRFKRVDPQQLRGLPALHAPLLVPRGLGAGAGAGAVPHVRRRISELDPLYAEVKERIADMNSYLDADSLRRQANTVVRLTVVTIFGLIGTVTTGFLGMNLLAEADAPLAAQAAGLWRRVRADHRADGLHDGQVQAACRTFSTHCPTSGCRCG